MLGCLFHPSRDRDKASKVAVSGHRARDGAEPAEPVRDNLDDWFTIQPRGPYTEIIYVNRETGERRSTPPTGYVEKGWQVVYKPGCTTKLYVHPHRSYVAYEKPPDYHEAAS